MRERDWRPQLQYKDQETHYVWGKSARLRVISHARRANVELAGAELKIQTRGEATPEKLRAILNAWHRTIIFDAALPLIEKWRPRLKAPAVILRASPMKSRWGSCSPAKKRITLNTALATRPPMFLEYVVVHELAHFRAPNHGPLFIKIMDRFLPDWRAKRRELNSGSTRL